MHELSNVKVYTNLVVYKKYGVVILWGMTLSESGTALKSLASRCSVFENSRMEAMLPQR